MAQAQGGMSRFYTLLAVVGGVGLALLGYLALRRPADTPIPVDVTIQASDTAGFRGYFLGSDAAPVEVTEFADYQCPACQNFEAVQFPAVRSRLVETGKVRWRYRDFPLEAHPHARLAAHAAACADEQGQYWPMHQRIYDGQMIWSARSSAAGTFRDYAGAVGLDLGRYDDCMSSARYAGRIQAGVLEGNRLGVEATPSFIIGNRLFRGVQSSDDIARVVDSLIQARQAAPPAP